MNTKSQLKIVVDNTNKSSPFITERHPIFGGKAEVIRTKQSGDVFHLRMWIPTENKYYRQSLRTKQLDSAIQRAEDKFIEISHQCKSGQKIFSPTVGEAIALYTKYREADVKRGYIVEGRLSTIKTQLKHFKSYLNGSTRMSELERKSLVNYQAYRQSKGAKDATIRNEQATINNLCAFAFEEGLHSIPKFTFPKITRRGIDVDDIRRSTFTDDEYQLCYTDLKSYTSKAQIKKDRLDDDKAFVRHLFRAYFLIAANTMMRTGELFGLKWGDVETYDSDGERLARVTVRAETSKVRKTRTFVCRRGTYFDRLKSMSNNTNDSDFVFTLNDGTNWDKNNRRALDYQYTKLMERVGISGYKERKLQLYSLRHYGITKRIQNGASHVQLSLDCGTSVAHITQTYYHTDLSESERNAIVMKD